MSAPIPITDPLSLAWLKHQEEHREPPTTIARRRATLRQVGNAGTATREELEAWWITRADKAPATRSNDLATLRTFYKWCDIWEHRDDDPTRRIKAPKVDKGLPRAISRSELRTVIRDAPDDLRRAIALGALAGLRVSEVAALNWGDIDTEGRRARVMGAKGGKSRLVALGPTVIDELLPERPGMNVVTGTKAAYTAATLQRKANRSIQRAGVRATFHQLRHRYGTLAYQESRDLLAVGRQMGHSSPVSTAVYAAPSDEMADRIAGVMTW